MQTDRNAYRINADNQKIAERAYDDIHSIADRPCRKRALQTKQMQTDKEMQIE